MQKKLEYIKLDILQFLFVLICLLFREILLAYSAERAHPIFWQVFKSCSWINTILWVTYFWVVNITADIANVLFHNLLPFFALND